MTRTLLLASLFLTVVACGTYRSNIGAYRTPSDYAYPPPQDSFKIAWPVGTVHINQKFHEGQDFKHEGVDLGGVKNSPVFAAHGGMVIYAGNGYHGYGNMVLIEFNREWATLYGHLNRILVRTGETVTAGAPIGAMGKTGHATGVHLHFELLHNRLPIDPLPLLISPRQLAGKSQRHRQLSSN